MSQRIQESDASKSVIRFQVKHVFGGQRVQSKDLHPTRRHQMGNNEDRCCQYRLHHPQPRVRREDFRSRITDYDGKNATRGKNRLAGAQVETSFIGLRSCTPTETIWDKFSAFLIRPEIISHQPMALLLDQENVQLLAPDLGLFCKFKEFKRIAMRADDID